MEASFWHEKWAKNEIGFHEPSPNQFLVKWFNTLQLTPGERIFLPLCGKTLDIGWLLCQGVQVAGAELSEHAVRQLFAELQLTPSIRSHAQMKQYSAQNIDIFVGDIFALDANMLGSVHAIYDRAAMVALPPATRPLYTQHLMNLTNTAQQLLICFEYDQSVMPGPPFAISPAEVNTHYQATYVLNLLSQTEVAGGLKGVLPATESTWLLTPKPTP